MGIIEKLKYNQFYKDSFWAILGNGASKGLGMISGIYVANKLGSTDFGDLGVVRTTVLNFAIFSTFGMAYTATKFISEAKVTNNYPIADVSKSSLKITLLLSGFVALILLIFAKDFSSLIFGDSSFINATRIAAIWLVFYSLTYTQTGILAGLGLFKKMAKVNFYVGVYTFISGILATYYYGFNGALWSFFTAYILNFVLNGIVLKKSIIEKPGVNRTIFKALVQFSTPIALQEFVYTFTSWLMIVGLKMLSESSEVGLFSASMQWSTLIIFLPSILRNVILKNFSSNTKDNGNMVEKSLKLVLLVTLIPSLLLIVFQKPILYLYGNTYGGISPVITVILIASIFMGLNTVYNQSFISQNKNWLMFWMRFFRDVGILLCSFILFDQKVYTPALSLAVSYLILNVLFFVLAYFLNQRFSKSLIQEKITN